MKTFILSHTDRSLRCYTRGLGEMANVEVLIDHMRQLDKDFRAVDLCHLFGVGEEGRKDFFPVLRLPGADGPPRFDNDHTRRFCNRLERALGAEQHPLLFVLTFRPVLDCVVSSGVLKSYPAITRVHPLEEEAWIGTELYGDVDLMVTQTLLGIRLASEQGIEPWRLLYVPYQTPPGIEKLPRDQNFRKRYLEGVAERMGKPLRLTDETVVVVCPTRFDFRKNIEYALQAFAKIHAQVPNALLLLKGSFDRIGDIGMGKGYTQKMVDLVMEVGEEPWFLWDPERRSSHREALQILQSCDIGLNLCGTPDPLNSTIEMLFLEKPVVLLEGAGPPCAMQGAVKWVRNRGVTQMRLGSHPFYLPEMDHLKETLVRLIKDAEARQVLGRQAKTLATLRFCPDLARERVQLMLEAARHYYHETEQVGHFQATVRRALLDDERRFNWEETCAS